MCSEYRCKTSHQFTDTAVRPGAVHGAESAESKQAVTHRGANDSFFFFFYSLLEAKIFFYPFSVKQFTLQEALPNDVFHTSPHKRGRSRM